MNIDETSLEKEIYSFGYELISSIREKEESGFSIKATEDKILNWAMKHEDLKVNLFRFVDVLPALHSSSEVVRNVHEYFHDVKDKIPLFKYALKVSPNSILSQGAAYATRHQIRKMSRRFIVGEDPKDALPYLKNLRKRGIPFTVDLLGEAAVSENESREYVERYLSLVEALKQKDRVWRQRYPLKTPHPKDSSVVHISIKLSALFSQAKPVDFERSVTILSERLTEILRAVKEVDGTAYVDMEDCSFTDITLEVVKRVYLSDEFRFYPGLGIVLQAYLKRTDKDIDEITKWARERGCPLQVRLVKGAYWDTEIIIAQLHGWPIPVYLKKDHSDASFEHLSKKLLDSTDCFYPAFASHNIRSIAHAVSYASQKDIPASEFEIQTLYGMGDEFKEGLIEKGYLVRDYAPVGELIPGMGYLVRRLLENTANEGFLRKTSFEKINIEDLLEAPEKPFDSENENLPMEVPLGEAIPDAFFNIPLLDFTIEKNRLNYQEAVNEIRESLKDNPFTVKPLLNVSIEKEDETETAVINHLPEDRRIKFSKTYEADKELCDKVLDDLTKSRHAWGALPVDERSKVLREAARIMTERRFELAAIITFEAGKPWTESDADVCEAIDFCNYYASEAERIFKKRRMGSLQGEYNTYFYEPRGISAVITPWNFALAIPTGMFASSLVCGNAVILKPAEQTPVIAGKMFEIFLEAGMPSEVAAFLPGKGEVIGAYLSKDPRVDTVSFTGSREVGFKLIQNGGNVHQDSRHIKRVVAEMGGKNAIVVDSDADLDEAVKGIITSAFGFQGQKCSACSRLYVVSEETYKRCKERLEGAIKSLKTGFSTDPSSFMGPVISEEARDKIQKAVEQANSEGKLVSKGQIDEDVFEKGSFIVPHLFSDIDDESSLMEEEIFGPLLIMGQVSTFEEGISKALSSKYRLTGGIYSRSPANIDYAIKHFNTGNLYINRNCTGALVYRQPFGGAYFSGIGAKAGGPDYLLQFVVPRTVTENTMRRGFAPEVR